MQKAQSSHCKRFLGPRHPDLADFILDISVYDDNILTDWEVTSTAFQSLKIIVKSRETIKKK